ncbi:MAG TPA: hypothetical protein VLV83_21045 [Acidobacteriota bacterium]|nr:hypothetical protein [Acidobacteriota bacterium]
MNRLLVTAWLLLWPCLLWAQQPQEGAGSGQDQQGQVEINPDVTTQARVAVADFVARTSANRATEEAAETFNRVLWDDLEFSARFEMPSKSFYPLRPIRNASDVSFEDWQVPTLDVDYLAFGNIQVDVNGTVLEAFLYDVGTREQIIGQRYRLTRTEQIRRSAHAFADQVVFNLTAGASRGVAQTQIAFTSEKGGSKEIYVVDYDGFNERTITANDGLNKFPDWSNENRYLAFVTNLPGSARWELWVQDLEGASGRQVIQVPTTYVSSPSFSPDGSRLALSARAVDKSDPDVFIADIERALSGQGGGSRLRNLTNHPSIDTAPTWSPTGRQLAFISDRSGTPQIWMMDADGSNLRRLTQDGGHCDSPDWSPDGRRIAFSWQAPRQWKHDIFIIDVATGVTNQVTSGRGSAENPHWSPDGRHLVFQSTRTGSKQIFIVNVDGENLKQITAYGINENPAWSGYRSLER